MLELLNQANVNRFNLFGAIVSHMIHLSSIIGRHTGTITIT